MRRTQLIAVLAALLALSGCVGKLQPAIPQSNNPRPSVQALLSKYLPALPDSREASATNLSEVNGKDTFSRSPNTSDYVTSLELTSGPGEISWGMWQLNPPLEKLESVQVVMDIPEGDEAWVGTSDYSLGTWDFDGPFTSSESIELDDAKQRSPEGNLYIAVVTAGGNLARVHKLVLTSEDGWVIVALDTSDHIIAPGKGSSLALIGGKPAISYCFNDYDLKYIRSLTSTGDNLEDWQAETVDSAGQVGMYCSLAEVDGWPAISYDDSTNHSLKYARLYLGELGPKWTKVVVDDGGGDAVGTYTSLLVVGGYPRITYRNQTQHCLCLAWSDTRNGMDESDWQTTISDDTDDCGRYTSFAEVDGSGAVSYCGDVVAEIRYRWFGLPTKIAVATATSGTELRSPSLAVVNGKPAISYYMSQTGSGYLLYSYSTTPRGTDGSDWLTVLVDDADYSGYDSSLAVINGRPAISYLHEIQPENEVHLMFAWSSTPGGETQADWQIIDVDSSRYTGNSTSLVEVGGKPAISYFDVSNNCLMYAIRMGP